MGRESKRLTNHRAKMLKRIRSQDPKLVSNLENLKIDWYRITNSADGEVADLYVYDEILPQALVDWFGGVSAQSLIDDLSEITASTINLRINSPGGDVYEAIAILNTLINHPATINVYVDALAASAASIIAMAGDTITMMTGSQMMIHDAMGIELGNAADMRAMADFLDKQSDNIASIYANKAGGEISDWRNLMLAETWLFAQEAVDMGLADEVYTKPANADTPAQEESETPEEEAAETPEEQQQEEEEGTEQPVQALMNKRHSLVNRGFKYAGRSKAPSPVDQIVNGTIEGEYKKFIDNLVDQMFN